MAHATAGAVAALGAVVSFALFQAFLLGKARKVRGRPVRMFDLIVTSQDNSYSLSRLQIYIWTVVVLAAMAAVWGARGKLPETLESIHNLCILMGLNVATAVSSTAIYYQKERNGQAPTKRSDKEPDFWSDIFFEAPGSLDLPRTQMFAWTVVSVLIFGVQVARSVAGDEPRIEDLSPLLVAFMGISNGAYVGTAAAKKPSEKPAAEAAAGNPGEEAAAKRAGPGTAAGRPQGEAAGTKAGAEAAGTRSGPESRRPASGGAPAEAAGKEGRMPRKKLVVVHGVQVGDNASAIQGPRQFGEAVDDWVDGAFEVALTTPAYEDINDSDPALKGFRTLSREVLRFIEGGGLAASMAAIALDRVVDLVGDVFVYRDKADARRIRARVLAAVEANPNCVLAGHSLGSVVCFDAVAELAGQGRFQGDPAGWPVSGLITFGSPLALGLFADARAIPDLGGAERLRWFNFFDRDDPIVSEEIFGKKLRVNRPIGMRYGTHPDWDVTEVAVNTGWHLVSHVHYWDQQDIVAQAADLLDRSAG